MNDRDIRVSGIGWVLPWGAGAGADVLDRPEWCAVPPPGAPAALDTFDVRPYISSVKGYLDPSGAYTLAAASLALGAERARGGLERVGIGTATDYGAVLSGYRFFSQMLAKGARLASPLIFPHSYPNTPGNLLAIEFGFGGPHMVMFGGATVPATLEFAVTQLRLGRAADMLVAAYEATGGEAVPADRHVLDGAVALVLSATDHAAGWRLDADMLRHAWAGGTGNARPAGAVATLIDLLQTGLVRRAAD